MTADVPNAFVQTPMPEAKIGERVMVKVTGTLVKLLVELDHKDTRILLSMRKEGQSSTWKF